MRYIGQKLLVILWDIFDKNYWIYLGKIWAIFGKNYGIYWDKTIGYFMGYLR